MKYVESVHSILCNAMPVLTVGELMAESRAINRVSLNGSEPSSKLTYVCVISCEFLYTFGVKLLFISTKLSFKLLILHYYIIIGIVEFNILLSLFF